MTFGKGRLAAIAAAAERRRAMGVTGPAPKSAEKRGPSLQFRGGPVRVGRSRDPYLQAAPGPAGPPAGELIAWAARRRQERRKQDAAR